MDSQKSINMLKVYYWDVCPHCHRAMEFLKKNNVPFEALDIEKQPEKIVKKVVEVNGGDDWVVPTMEYNGQWRRDRYSMLKNLKPTLKLGGLCKLCDSGL